MATLGTTFLGGFLALGGSKKSTQDGPALNATSKDEERFIQYVRREGGTLWLETDADLRR